MADLLTETGAGDSRAAGGPFTHRNILRWAYFSRFAVVSGMLLGALIVWGETRPEYTFLASVMFFVGLASSLGGIWWTEILEKAPGRSFLVGQVALDALLVTGVVHITGGGESNFAWLYILVISEGALLLPISGGLLLATLASILYFADIVWGHDQSFAPSIGLQIGIFAVVAAATGIIGDRLRRARVELGEMESELRRLRLDTTEILATISSGVLTLDEAGGVVYRNPAAEALLGLRPGVLEESDAMDEITRVAPELAGILRSSLTNRTASHRLRFQVERGGEHLVLGVSTFLREEEGDPLAVTAIFQDITDLERVSALNRRAERLEAIAALSASLAHEIKNPLASIRSAVEQFASPHLQDRDRASLTLMVVRESDRLSRLLTDFLDFSRSRIDRVEPARLSELVVNAVTVVREHPAVATRKVRILLDPRADDAEVRVDVDLVSRALLNLLLNAAQFTAEGTDVNVVIERPARVPAGVRVANPVRVRVRDHGPGVPPDLVERIFDPFYTTRPGGTGLGLAVVYRMVEAHGGIILVESPDDGGAEFQLYLPEQMNSERREDAE